MKLTILRGISGSGKSTVAEMLAASGAKVVSRDAIRIGIYNTEWNPDIENDVTVWEHNAIAGFLDAGFDVVSDNTNIQNQYVKAIAKIGFQRGAEVEIKVIDCDLPTAIKRNDHRAALGGRFVDHAVIERQYEQFKKTRNYSLPDVPPINPYSGTPGKPKAFLVDIDGTLAHMNGKRGPFDWKNVGVDDVDEKIAMIVQILGATNWALDLDHLKVIVMSGRDEVCRGETEEWLMAHEIYFDEFFMRPANDFRPDNIIKAELFDKYVRDNYDVQFVLDDRDQVVRMWRAMGITCLQVAPGDF